MDESQPSPQGAPDPNAGTRAAPRLNRLTGEMRDQLVAYLDGECDEETAQSIDHLLATNEVARKEVDRLSTAYELLDHLPRPAASTEFTNETMKSVQLMTPVQRDVSGDLRAGLTPWLPALRTSVLAFVCTLGGLVAGQMMFRSPTDAILADLDAIQSVQGYQAVGDPEFVEWVTRDSIQKRIEGTLRGE